MIIFLSDDSFRATVRRSCHCRRSTVKISSSSASSIKKSSFGLDSGHHHGIKSLSTERTLLTPPYLKSITPSAGGGRLLKSKSLAVYQSDLDLYKKGLKSF